MTKQEIFKKMYDSITEESFKNHSGIGYKWRRVLEKSPDFIKELSYITNQLLKFQQQ